MPAGLPTSSGLHPAGENCCPLTVWRPWVIGTLEPALTDPNTVTRHNRTAGMNLRTLR